MKSYPNLIPFKEEAISEVVGVQHFKSTYSAKSRLVVYYKKIKDITRYSIEHPSFQRGRQNFYGKEGNEQKPYKQTSRVVRNILLDLDHGND